MKKERYRKNAKKKAINSLNKKNAVDHANKKVNKKIKPLLGVEDRLKRKRNTKEKLKDKDSPRQAREFVNSKKNEIYRRNARKKSHKNIN